MNHYKTAVEEICQEKKISEKKLLEKLPFLKPMLEEN